MEAERASFPVKMMARLLGVSRSGFYDWLARGDAPDPWSGLRECVRRLWVESDRTFGARMLRAMLPAEHERATLYRVRKLMCELGRRGVAPNSKKRTTVPDEGAPSRPDLIRRDFTAAVPCTRLVGDITYLKTGQGWLYLATVIDLCTRMVVGWAISERMTADIAVEALERARGRGCVAGNAIFHSDRGAQYTSRLLARWAAEHEVRLSVGRTGSCHDNVVAESFFGTLKNEMYHRRKWKTRLEAGNAVIDFIEAQVQPLEAALGDRQPDTGRGDGVVLREDRAEAGCAGRGGSGSCRRVGYREKGGRSMSEILTHLRGTSRCPCTRARRRCRRAPF